MTQPRWQWASWQATGAQPAWPSAMTVTSAMPMTYRVELTMPAVITAPGGMIVSGGDAIPVTLAPGEQLISATACAAQVNQALQYIDFAYGNRPAVSSKGILWSTRPLTIEEMLA